jgi:hypothetical protein
MRAISIKQPFAWLVVTGKKNIENRSWYTHHRGPLAIHAGLRMADEELEEIARRYRVRILPEALQRGGIIGTVNVVDVVTEHGSRWFQGPFGWVLKNAKQTRFLPMTGKQGFMSVPDKKLQFIDG